MRLRLAFLAVLLGAFTAHGQVFGRWNKNDEGSGKTKNPILLSLSLLPPDSECSGTPPDGVTFTRASSATCSLDDGALPSNLATNRARVTAKGLLVEGSSTNNVISAQNVSHEAWTKTPEVTCSTTACDFVGTGTFSQTLSGVSGLRNTSFYVMRRTETRCSSLTVSRDGGATPHVVNLPNVGAQWYRVAATCPVGAVYCIEIPGLASTVTDPEITVTATDCYTEISWFQDEAGGIPTSFIPTSGTAAVRATENPRVASPESDFLLAGCAALDLTPYGWSDPTQTTAGPYLLGTVENNTASRMLYVLPGASEIRNYDGARFAGIAVSFGDGVADRYVSRWGNGVMSVCADSVGCSPDVAGFVGFPGGGDLVLGANSNTVSTNNRAYGYLSNLVLGATPEACQ